MVFDNADCEAGQVEVARHVEIRHLRRLATQQCTTSFPASGGHPFDYVLQVFRVKLVYGQIIEKKERLGSTGHQIVDVHGHQVDADRRQAVHPARQQNLGAYAIRASDQHRFPVVATKNLLVVIQVEQPGESTVPGLVHARAVGAPHGRLNRSHPSRARLHVNTGLFISNHCHQFRSRDCLGEPGTRPRTSFENQTEPRA